MIVVVVARNLFSKVSLEMQSMATLVVKGFLFNARFQFQFTLFLRLVDEQLGFCEQDLFVLGWIAHPFLYVIEGEGDAQRNPSEQTGEAQGEAAKQES